LKRYILQHLNSYYSVRATKICKTRD